MLKTNTLLTYFGIPEDLESSPVILRQILREEMELLDHEPTCEIMRDLLEGHFPLTTLVDQILEGIDSQHFEIAAILEETIDEASPQQRFDGTNQEAVRIIHHILVLDCLIKKMVADYRFMISLKAHLFQKRASYGLNATVQKDGLLQTFLAIRSATNETFFAFKTATMDYVFETFCTNRENGCFPESHDVSAKIGVAINILEAALTDFFAGNFANARVGFYLMRHPHDKLELDAKDQRYYYRYKKGWESLYETWNLAFILGNMKNLDLLLPKLLAPSVIGAQKDEYLFHRALGLWCSINFYLFRKLKGVPDKESPFAHKIASRLGELNLEKLNHSIEYE